MKRGVRMFKDLSLLKDGEPCGHRGCLSHLSHPCEGCGRIGGKRDGHQLFINSENRDSLKCGIEYDRK